MRLTQADVTNALGMIVLNIACPVCGTAVPIPATPSDLATSAFDADESYAALRRLAGQRHHR